MEIPNDGLLNPGQLGVQHFEALYETVKHGATKEQRNAAQDELLDLFLGVAVAKNDRGEL